MAFLGHAMFNIQTQVFNLCSLTSFIFLITEFIYESSLFSLVKISSKKKSLVLLIF